MLIVVSLYPLFLVHLEIIQKFRNNSFFSNSSTKLNFTNLVANSHYICLYIVYDSLCFGGSSTKPNIVSLAMLDKTYRHYPHVEGIIRQGSLSSACIDQNNNNRPKEFTLFPSA